MVPFLPTRAFMIPESRIRSPLPGAAVLLFNRAGRQIPPKAKT
jgi:hypothetical protein